MTFSPSQMNVPSDSLHSPSDRSSSATIFNSPRPHSSPNSIESIVPAGLALLERIQQELDACKRSLPNPPAPEDNTANERARAELVAQSKLLYASVAADHTLLISGEPNNKLLALIRKDRQIKSDYQAYIATCRDTQVAYTRHVNCAANSLINTIQILFSRSGLNNFDMNSSGRMIADTASVDLSSNAGDALSQHLPHNPNSGSRRRYKTGGATFTANRQGVFEVRYADVVQTFFLVSRC